MSRYLTIPGSVSPCLNSQYKINYGFHSKTEMLLISRKYIQNQVIYSVCFSKFKICITISRVRDLLHREHGDILNDLKWRSLPLSVHAYEHGVSHLCFLVIASLGFIWSGPLLWWDWLGFWEQQKHIFTYAHTPETISSICSCPHWGWRQADGERGRKKRGSKNRLDIREANS